MSNQVIQIYDEEKLKTLIKEAIRDVLEEELMKIRLLLSTYISDEEQEEIEKLYGKPCKETARILTLEE